MEEVPSIPSIPSIDFINYIASLSDEPDRTLFTLKEYSPQQFLLQNAYDYVTYYLKETKYIQDIFRKHVVYLNLIRDLTNDIRSSINPPIKRSILEHLYHEINSYKVLANSNLQLGNSNFQVVHHFDAYMRELRKFIIKQLGINHRSFFEYIDQRQYNRHKKNRFTR